MHKSSGVKYTAVPMVSAVRDRLDLAVGCRMGGKREGEENLTEFHPELFITPGMNTSVSR